MLITWPKASGIRLKEMKKEVYTKEEKND